MEKGVKSCVYGVFNFVVYTLLSMYGEYIEG